VHAAAPAARGAANYDLHAHSTVSDGLLSPAALVARAAARGVSHLALTDHDDLGGLAEARQAAAAAGVQFINGVEISAEWAGAPIHLVGLGLADEAPQLAAALASVRAGRQARARRMGEAFAALGMPGVLEGALRHAGNPQLLSRAHFARHLVELGLFGEPRQVFEHYLVPGKPGYVEHRWPELGEAVDWIRGAGGLAVLAHPGRYRMSGAALRRLIGDFVEAGGAALEVVCAGHTADHVRHFARLVRHFGLNASRGSDFHGPGESYIDLGALPPLPEDLRPVWRLFDFRPPAT
jgi:predicted metal-dependent phosphoesterase TrpH